MTFQWDIFISHASEDRESFVVPLVSALQERGLTIWFDRCMLSVGDSLRAKIDEGLSCSRFGAVVLSSFFFAKDWPRLELDGLLSRERYGRKLILPVWHNVSREDVLKFSPILAGRLAADSSTGIEEVAAQLHRAVTKSAPAGSPVQGSTGDSDGLRPMNLTIDEDDLTRFYKAR